jgi:hypothetical protein
MSEVYQPREGLGIKDPKFTPRVDAEERAEELGLPDPGTILQSAQKYITETGVTNVDQDLLREKKIEFYKAIKDQEPEVWEFMKKNNLQIKPEDWQNLPLDLIEQARNIAYLQAPNQEMGFDYTSGVGSPKNEGTKFSRFTLSRLDTNTEKEDFLNLTVGYDGWTTDKFGRYALTQKGLELLGEPALQPNEKGRVIDEYQGYTKYDWVDAAPHIIQAIPPVVASVALNPYGTVIGLVGTGVVGAGSYLGDELIEYAQGWSNQSAESVAYMAGQYALYNTLGEGVARALRPIGRLISDPQGFKFRGNAPYTRDAVLKAYPNLENDIRAMYGTTADGTPMPEVEIQKLVNKTIKHLKYKTPITGDTSIPGASDAFNPNTRTVSYIPGDRRKIIADILEGDGTYSGTPSISVASQRPLLGRLQGLFDNMFGYPRDEANRRYLNHTMLLLQGKAAGISDDQLKNYAAKFGTDGELTALNDLNEAILKRVTDSSQSYDDTLTLIMKNLEEETDAAINYIRSQTGLLPDAEAAKLAERLKQNKFSIETAIEGFGNNLDNSLHGLKLFETGSIKQQIELIKKSLPKKTTIKEVTEQTRFRGPETVKKEVTEFNEDIPGVTQILKLINGIEELPQRTSALQLSFLDKGFKTLKAENGKIGGLDFSRELDNILNSIDDSYSGAKGILDTHTAKLSVSDKVRFKEAYSLLDDLTKLRNDSQGMFDDVFVAKMIQDAKSGAQGFIESQDVVTYFVGQGRNKAFLRLLNALPASEREVFKAGVARQTFDNVVNSSKNNLTGDFEGYGFINAWNKIDDGIKKTLFGTNTGKIDTLAKQIAIKNGKFSQEEVSILLNSNDDNITKLLNNKLKLLNEQDEILGKNWIKKILSDDVEVEQVIDYIFRPKSSTKINQAKEFLGDDLFTQLREASMLKILQNVGTDATQPGFGPIFNGPSFRKALDLYGKDTLQAMFGKDLTKDLYKFADQITILTSKNQSGGLVAASVALKPLTQGPKALISPLLPFRVMAYLMNRPGFVEYLTFGIKNPYTRKGSEAFAKIIAMTSAQGVQEKLVGSEGRGNEILPVEGKSTMENIMDAPSDAINRIPFVGGTSEKVPVSNLNFNVNPASRLSEPTIDPNRAALAFGSDDILTRALQEQTPRFAAKGGIMNTKKAFQRVA